MTDGLISTTTTWKMCIRDSDRSIDRAIIESTSVPCIIAGGLDASNVAEAIHETHPYGVDSFSLTNFDQVEEGKGCKDPEKVKAFIEASLNA